ncbi:MAG: hypothetical protein WCQ50_14825 [Spirochaetota bacterium]
MSSLLNKKLSLAPKGASLDSSSARKIALDAFLTELGRGSADGPANDEPGTVYDRDYQKKNPFSNSRDEDVEVPMANDPVLASVDFQTGMVGEGKDRHPRHLPPRNQNIRSKSTEQEMEAEKKKDSEGYKQSAIRLTATDTNFDFEADRSGRIARKIASNSLFKQYVTARNVKVDSDSLIINIPRGKSAHTELSLGRISEMEKHISSTLKVRAKFAHVILSSGFDGIALEFLMV